MDAGEALDPEQIAPTLASIPGVVAVTLGGSRAQSTHLSGSDWDFGLYYRHHLDTDAIRGLRWKGEVTEPGAWAYPMNGGAWLTLQSHRVDLIYRDLDDVEGWIKRAQQGEWELYRVPGYLAGMPSYTLLAELAVARVLIGSLPRPMFPEALRVSARRRWRWEAGFALDHADTHAGRGEFAACFGKLAYALIAFAHVRLAQAGEWTINEKRLVERAGLLPCEDILRQAASERRYDAAVDQLRALLREDTVD